MQRKMKPGRGGMGLFIRPHCTGSPLYNVPEDILNTIVERLFGEAMKDKNSGNDCFGLFLTCKTFHFTYMRGRKTSFIIDFLIEKHGAQRVFTKIVTAPSEMDRMIAALGPDVLSELLARASSTSPDSNARATAVLTDAVNAAVAGDSADGLRRISRLPEGARLLSVPVNGSGNNIKEFPLVEAAVVGSKVDALAFLLEYLQDVCKILSVGGAFKRFFNRCLKRACEIGNATVVTMLLERSPASSHNKDLKHLPVAAGRGHLDVVRILIRDIRANSKSDALEQLVPWAIASACAEGHWSVVSDLLESSSVDPAYEVGNCIQEIVSQGCVDKLERFIADYGCMYGERWKGRNYTIGRRLSAKKRKNVRASLVSHGALAILLL